MAAVLGGQPGDERRLPQGAKAMRHAHRGEAAELGVHEDHPTRFVDAEFVHVDIARGLGVARDIEPVEMLVGPFVWRKHIFQPPDLEERADIETLRRRVQAHGAHIILLVEADLAVGQHADEKELPGLVGAEGEAAIVADQPVAEAAGDTDLGLVGGGLRRLRGGLRFLDRDVRRQLFLGFGLGSRCLLLRHLPPGFACL